MLGTRCSSCLHCFSAIISKTGCFHLFHPFHLNDLGATPDNKPFLNILNTWPSRKRPHSVYRISSAYWAGNDIALIINTCRPMSADLGQSEPTVLEHLWSFIHHVQVLCEFTHSSQLKQKNNYKCCLQFGTAFWVSFHRYRQQTSERECLKIAMRNKHMAK